MTSEVSKKQMCILIRYGIELWIDQERSQRLLNALQGTDTRFVELDGRLINRADLVGIFEPKDLMDMKRRKNGEWTCEKGEWHSRNQECDCRGVDYSPTPQFEEISDEQRLKNLEALEKIRNIF